MFEINKNLDFNFLQTEPYYIFKIENFLTDNFYNNLNQNLNSFCKNEIKNLNHVNYKYSLNSRQKNYKNIISNYRSFVSLHNNIFNKDFINFFYDELYAKMLYSRITDFKFFLKFLRFKKFELNKKNFLERIFYTHIDPVIEYSFIKNEGKIVPHTDSRYKLLSLMLYFPDKILSDNQKIQLGTTFYKSKKKNLNNSHLNNSIEEENFKNTYSEKIVLPFKEKHLYGFIRNKYSWHSVEPFSIDTNFIRKSININLYF